MPSHASDPLEVIAPRPCGAARNLAAHDSALFDSLEQLLFQKTAQPVKERRATPRCGPRWCSRS